MIATLAVTLTPTSISSAEVGDIRFDKKVTALLKKQEANVKRQLACLARNVFYEAGSESMNGQMAVAQVTVNRARSGLFPRDLCAVVAQSTVVGDDRVCQFSWMCDARVNKQRKISPNNSSYIAAKRVLVDGQKVAKIDENVMWFHATNVQIDPHWPHKVATKIGNHVFYKREK